MNSGKKTIHRDELDQTLNREDPLAYVRRTGRDTLEERFRAFANALPRTDDGGLDPAVLCDRPCPLCACRDSEELFTKYGFPIHACDRCGFEFARPMLDPDRELTPADREWTERMAADHLAFITKSFYRDCATRRFEYELQQVLSLIETLPPRPAFLEVGSSIGLGLSVAARYGFEVVGVEPDRGAADWAERYGFEVHRDYFRADLFPDRKFDVVMTLDVLEHVPDPVGFLCEIRKILKPGGLVLVQVPNAGALITWLEGSRNQIYNGLIHLNYFDPASLNRTALTAGLNPRRTTSFLSELGKILAFDRDHIREVIARHRPDLVDGFELHQDWINDSGLGYKVLGIFAAPG